MQTVTEGYGRMKNYIFRFKHSIGSKFVAAVAALLSILILISYGFSAWYMIHSVQEKFWRIMRGLFLLLQNKWKDMRMISGSMRF